MKTAVISPDVLLSAYCQGLFPMAENAQSDEINWYSPQKRAQISISDMHIPRRLKKSVRQMKIQDGTYTIKINTSFKKVMEACAEHRPERQETWINQTIIDSYSFLHELGHAHSVETWIDDDLVGGLYGVSIGGAFFGESMFSRATDASKIALVHLVARLHHAGFKILDTQFTNDHLEQFGVYEIDHEEYVEKLKHVLDLKRTLNFKNENEREVMNRYLSIKND